jgi:hypothetical protein
MPRNMLTGNFYHTLETSYRYPEKLYRVAALARYSSFLALPSLPLFAAFALQLSAAGRDRDVRATDRSY